MTLRLVTRGGALPWSTVLLIYAICGSWLASAGSPAGAEETYVRPLNLKPEPLAIEPGKPLSLRTLVTHPSPLDDVLSWTFESRLHRGILYSMALSPDRTQLATGGIDGTIRIWDVGSGELQRVMVGHFHVVFGLSWSPDGSVIASAGGWDCTVRFWDAKRGMPLRVFKDFKTYTHHVAWSPDGSQLVASGGSSGWVWLWKAAADKGNVLAEVGQVVRSVHWAPDGQHVALAVAEGGVPVLDLSTGKASATLGGEIARVNYVVRFSPDGSKVFVGNANQADVYAMPDGAPLINIPGPCTSGAWSPDGKSLCVANAAGGARICAADTGKVAKTIVTGGLEHFWVADDALFARGHQTLNVWSPTSGKQTQNYPITRSTPPVWTAGRPIVTGVGENKLTLWDNVTAKLQKTLEGHTGPITAVSWTRDGKTLASGSADKTIILWQAASGKTLHTLKEHQGPVTCVAWSPDGKTLASGGGGPNPAVGGDYKVRLWPANGSAPQALDGHTKPVNALAWSPRGNFLASGSADGTVRLWHPDGDLVRTLVASRPVLGLAFSPDGSLLAGATTDEVVRLWQTSSGAELNKHIIGPGTAPPTTTAVAWTPDGQGLFVGRANHLSQLWDWQEPKVIHNLQSTASADQVSVTTAGALVTATEDCAVRFWDAGDAGLRGSILSLEDGLLVLSADGNYRHDPAKQPSFVAVAQTATEQLLISPTEFGKKYRWKNTPTAVKFNTK